MVGAGPRRRGGYLQDEVSVEAMLIRSSRGMVGTTPPASRRDSAGWVGACG